MIGLVNGRSLLLLPSQKFTKQPLASYENPSDPILTQTGCVFYSGKSYKDDRGFFLETYKMSDFRKMYNRFKFETNFIWFTQDNLSVSNKNVVRGLHFQKNRPQGKLIRVLGGSVLDVALDINPNSKTYGCFEVFKLSRIEECLYVPPTHAHGFVALENTVFSYKCTDEYDPEDESGISPLDTNFDFPWFRLKDDLIISPKDRALPMFPLSN